MVHEDGAMHKKTKTEGVPLVGGLKSYRVTGLQGAEC